MAASTSLQAIRQQRLEYHAGSDYARWFWPRHVSLMAVLEDPQANSEMDEFLRLGSVDFAYWANRIHDELNNSPYFLS